ncbi:MAG: acyl carrier protein [Lachnospiraceae bacterium]|nr:acyl carrier protein [Lachnospiraceae bacterium]
MFETVKNILVEEMQIKEEDVTPEAELINDLGINSLELADMILICEERFNIEIKDEDIHKFITVGNVVDYLKEATGEN